MSDEDLLRAGGHEAFKPMEVITCSDGTTFPNTGMGGQSAAQHEHSLTYVRPKDKFRLALTWGDFHIWLTAEQFGVSKTERHPGGSGCWHPVHIGWTKNGPVGGRHINISRSAEKQREKRARSYANDPRNSGRSPRVR